MWWRVLLVSLITLLLIGVAGFVLVIWLVGPHGGVLPERFRPVILVLFWVSILVFPLLAARNTYRKHQAKLANTDRYNESKNS